MASGSLVGVSASSVSTQKLMHAFHSGLVFSQRKRCMMVSSALPHSRLVLPVAHERRPVYELAPLPLLGSVGQGGAHRGEILIKGDVLSYVFDAVFDPVFDPVFDAVGDFVLANDGGEVGCDGVYGEVGFLISSLATWPGRSQPSFRGNVVVVGPMRGVQGETCPASRCETCPGPLPCRGRARWARACVRNCAWITL
jgi:hypothetical protein